MNEALNVALEQIAGTQATETGDRDRSPKRINVQMFEFVRGTDI